MNNYDNILILHALDKTTSFLSVFKNEFDEYYFSFNSDAESVRLAKDKLGILDQKSLIIYLGHGNSSGLYVPNESNSYDNYFLDVSCGNLYFEKHDLFLLSCKSNQYLKKIYKSNSSIGFGDIISSKYELDHYNEHNAGKIHLDECDIDKFNEIYVNSSVRVIKKLINKEIYFFDAPKLLRFLINSEINKILIDKDNSNRISFSKLLFDFRNEFDYRKNNFI